MVKGLNVIFRNQFIGLAPSESPQIRKPEENLDGENNRVHGSHGNAMTHCMLYYHNTGQLSISHAAPLQESLLVYQPRQRRHNISGWMLVVIFFSVHVYVLNCL